MRNVNYQINAFFSNKEIGFILTMRNVNMVAPDIDLSPTSVLY